MLWGFICLLPISSGCTTSNPYLVDRARDAGDIVTLTAGFGAGVKVRTGPLPVGLLLTLDDIWGWRNGFYEPACMGCRMELIGLAFGGENFYNIHDTLRVKPSGKETMEQENSPAKTEGNGKQTVWKEKRSIQSLRGKYFRAAHLGISFVEKDSVPVRNSLFHPYYTQVEVCGGFLNTIRIGVNPGEFFDFLLGWIGVDFFDDDIGLIETNTVTEKKTPPGGEPEKSTSSQTETPGVSQ